MEWENAGIIEIIQTSQNAVTIPIPQSSPLLKIEALILNPLQIRYRSVGYLGLLTLDGTEILNRRIFQGSQVIELPGWLKLYQIRFTPERYLNNARVTVDRLTLSSIQRWKSEYMALISDIAAQGESIVQIQSNVSDLQTVASQLQSNAAKQFEFQFPPVQPQDQTYNFPYAILNHGLNDLRPSIVFYTDSGEAELLGYKVIDANSIVINCRGASNQINANWQIVITASTSSPPID